jgi:long-chain acyl-CoA synthetase
MTDSLQHATRIGDIPRHWALATPDAAAIVDGDRTVSYAALWQAVQQAAGLLDARGVRHGDRAMVVSENCAEQIILLFALSELGAWPVIVNARLSAHEVEAIRAHCGPRLMLFTSAVSGDARLHAQHYGATDCGDLGMVAAGPTDAAAICEPHDLTTQLAALIYTSGTTGAPKGVMISHRGLLHFARVSSDSRALAAADVAYAALPVSHIFGLGSILLSTLYAGASVHLRARFTPADALQALSTRRISILQGVPAMFIRLLERLQNGHAQLAAPQLRYLYAGGAPLDPTLKREVETVFGLPLHHGYGMTEYAGSLFITRMDSPRTDVSSGHIVAGAELRIVGPDGADLPPGEPGEILVRGPGTMLGYYRAPELTAQTLLPGGWMKTGDLGRRDADGALFIVGRSKDLIIRSGFNVYPVEVEAAINSFPGVKLSAVVGRPEADANESVVAFVETVDGGGLDIEALHAHLKKRLSPYKRPSAIYRIDTIPTTASGKLLKQGLRQLTLQAAGCTGSGHGPTSHNSFQIHEEKTA